MTAQSQFDIDRAYAITTEEKGAAYMHVLAEQKGGQFEPRFEDNNYRDGLLYLPGGVVRTVDFKACREAYNFPLELYRADRKTQSSAFKLDLALFYLEAERRWYLFNIRKWREFTDNFQAVEHSHRLCEVYEKQTRKLSAHVKWFRRGELTRAKCLYDVTQAVENAQLPRP